MPQYCLLQLRGKAKDLVFNLSCTFVLTAILTCYFVINLVKSVALTLSWGKLYIYNIYMYVYIYIYIYIFIYMVFTTKEVFFEVVNLEQHT